MHFEHIVRSVAELREILPSPTPRAVAKSVAVLDANCRAIIERSPFVIVASSDSSGELDVSPKGDPAGSVKVLDDVTLALPDRPGNRRADTFRNVLESPGVALLFMIPGRLETLRVNGHAMVVRDNQLLERLAIAGKPPSLALVVRVREAFVHCGRCMVRSGLWQPASWPTLDGLPSHARCLAEHAGIHTPIEQLQQEVTEGYQRLY